MATRYCKGCQAVVTGTWWCAGCKAKRGKPPTTRYGGAHQAKRSAERETAYGGSCVRCGRQLEPGQSIHLDHAADGQTYLGWSHARCNLSAGGRKGRAIQTGRLVANGHAALSNPTHVSDLPPNPAHVRDLPPALQDHSNWNDLPPSKPPELCPQCGRADCRRPLGLVSRCW